MKLYKYTSAKYAIEFLRTGKIKVATLEDVNDPNEWLPFIPALNLPDGANALSDRGRRAGFKKTFLNHYGFVSFSETLFNPVLWGHYADKGRGIVLEFEYSPDAKVLSVDYDPSQKRCRLETAGNSPYATEEDARTLLRRKGVEWAYEKEKRVIVELHDCDVAGISGNVPIYVTELKGLSLCGVVLGTECPLTFGHIVSELETRRNEPIAIKRLGLDMQTYMLIVSDECWINQSEYYTLKYNPSHPSCRDKIPLTGNE